jgi:hypothetical protein
VQDEISKQQILALAFSPPPQCTGESDTITINPGGNGPMLTIKQ